VFFFFFSLQDRGIGNSGGFVGVLQDVNKDGWLVDLCAG